MFAGMMRPCARQLSRRDAPAQTYRCLSLSLASVTFELPPVFETDDVNMAGPEHTAVRV